MKKYRAIVKTTQYWEKVITIKHDEDPMNDEDIANEEADNLLEAVAIVGRPVARRLDDGFTVEILRLCTKQTGIKNLCSLLYSRSWRLWKLMGGKRIITYTLEEENGASLKASGYKITGETQPFKKGTGWTTRKGRVWQKIQEQKRIRWEYNIG